MNTTWYYHIISTELYNRLKELGIISDNTRSYNIGESNYSKHLIQPWSIWLDYKLDPWDADIVKRVLRTKGNSEEEKIKNRITDYQKIIHICKEKLRQLCPNTYTKGDTSEKSGEKETWNPNLW